MDEQECTDPERTRRQFEEEISEKLEQLSEMDRAILQDLKDTRDRVQSRTSPAHGGVTHTRWVNYPLEYPIKFSKPISEGAPGEQFRWDPTQVPTLGFGLKEIGTPGGPNAQMLYDTWESLEYEPDCWGQTIKHGLGVPE